MTETVDDILAHYGKKGMKWGVRRDERGLSDIDTALNVKQRTQVKVASSISALASMGMASNASATLFQLQSRFEHLRVVKEMQKYAEHSPLIDDAGREAIAQTRSHIVKGLVGSAIGATAISVGVGIVTRRTAKAYFAPLHKVYGDEKGKINRELKSLSKDIKDGKRPKMTKKQYEAEVTRIVSEKLTKDANNAVRPFHELARSQLGTEFNTKSLNIKIEKLPNTDLASKITITTPAGIKLVKAIKNVQHADADDIFAPDLELFFDYKFDDDGHVIEWSCPTLEIANDLFEGRFDVAAITEKYDPESSLQQNDPVGEFLEHYGTKGMKWGVRRQLKKLSPSKRGAFIKERDAKWLAKVEKDPKLSKVSRLTTRYAKKQTKLLKKDYKERGLNIKKSSLARSRYDNELKVILDQSIEKATYKAHKLSPSRLNEVQVQRHPDGTMTAKVVPRRNAKIEKQYKGINKADERRTRKEARATRKAANAELKQSDLMHVEAPTDDDFEGLEFLLVLDDEGFVDDIISPFDDEGDDDLDLELEQSTEDEVDSFLAHYGVRGMKWGVRKKSSPRPAFMPPLKKSEKPPWQSAPPKKNPTAVAVSPATTRRVVVGKGKNARVLSEDAAQFRELRIKVKREGLQSLNNKDIELINKRAEVMSKYNKAFPKKPSLAVKAANVAVDAILSEEGSKKVVNFLSGPAPRTLKKDQQAQIMTQLLTTGRTVRKATKATKTK